MLKKNNDVFTGETLIKTAEAIKICATLGIPGVAISTVHTWCKRYEIGKQVVGRWYINKHKLLVLLKGDTDDSLLTKEVKDANENKK